MRFAYLGRIFNDGKLENNEDPIKWKLCFVIWYYVEKNILVAFLYVSGMLLFNNYFQSKYDIQHLVSHVSFVNLNPSGWETNDVSSLSTWILFIDISEKV